MTTGCHEFRALLEAALAGRPDPPRLARLGWHEHLAVCAPCRAVLDQEEALELLLASLPDPQLPPDLRRRVLARLRESDVPASAAQGELALERLLDLDAVQVPVGLAARVHAAVRGDAEARLDALLERAGDVDVPPDLARRVLQRVARERAGAAPSARPVSRRLAVAAAVLVVGSFAGLLAVLSRSLGPLDRDVARARDERVIEALPVLDYMDALADLEPLERQLVARLDLADEALLDEGGR